MGSPATLTVSLLGGIVRGGTTLLLDLLKASPEVYADFEIGLLFMGSLSRAGLANWDREFGDPGPLSNLRSRYGITDGDLAAIARARTWHQAYEVLFEIMMRSEPNDLRRRRHLVDKMPHYSRVIRTAMQQMPSSRAVILFRDPRAVYASWYRRGHRDPREFVQQLNENMMPAVAQSRRTSRMLLVRYEHLVLDVAAVMKVVSAHLRIDYVDAMCDPSNAFRQHRKTAFKPLNGERRAAGLDSSEIDCYEQELPVSVRAVIEANVHKDLAFLFY